MQSLDLADGDSKYLAQVAMQNHARISKVTKAKGAKSVRAVVASGVWIGC